MWKNIALFLLLWVFLLQGNIPVSGVEKISPKYRLPNTVIPSAYTIIISPKIPTEENVKNSTFTGQITIKAKTKTEIDQITLHAKNLSITTVEVELIDDKKNIKVESIASQDKFDLLYLNLSEKISNQTEIEIRLTYSGIMASDMYGFYLSSYTEKDKTEYIGSTQMEATSARRAFPCFDEPAYKATFKIYIQKVPKGFSAISNMEEKKTAAQTDGSTNFEFDLSPPMSTYLVAFVVSKFVPATDDENADTKVWVRPSAKGQADYAQSIGRQILLKIGQLTGVSYFEKNSGTLKPGYMSKIDMIAIPDFAAGAMENWGLLTYRETALLYDTQSSTKKDRQRVACVIAHEQSHQWFGDLVTLAWWDNTWLNEGFATYFEYHTLVGLNMQECVSEEDCWEMKKQFVIEEHQTALLADSIPSSTPLTNPKTFSPSEIARNFGTISYNKGGSVIRMMEHFLGTDSFKKSLTLYLDTNHQGNTVPKNLFDAMQANADVKVLPKDKTMHDVMKNWIGEAGYPLITISANNTHYLMSQERFYLTQNKSDTIWSVPVAYANTKDQFEKPQTMWLTEKTGSLKRGEKDDLIVLNVNSRGYFRVKYEGDLLKNITKVLNNETTLENIPEINRAQLIDDMLNLARADMVKYQEALEFLDYLKNEKKYFPWSSAFSGLRFLMQRYAKNNSLGESLRHEILKMMSGSLYKFNETLFGETKNENVIQTYNRTLMLEWACNLGDQQCIEQSKKAFVAFIKNQNKIIPVDIRSIVYCNALRSENTQKVENGMTEYFKFLWNLFKKSNVAAEKINIIKALGCTKNEENLKTFLDFSLNENEVRKQDASYVFSSVYSGNDVNIKKALTFLTEKWESISTHYGGMNALSKVVSGLADRLTDNADMDMLKNFMANEKVAKLIEDVKEEVEIIMAANLKWAQTNNDEIKEFVCKRNSGYAVCKKKEGGANAISSSVLLIFLSIFFVYYRRN